MTELGDIFAELGISHYLDDFLEQGFDTWETILDITESDFDALGVKLGHRRKLQRKIANARGLSSDKALASSRNTPTDDRQADDTRNGGVRVDNRDGAGPSQGAKRKYRRHPKPDENAPERPPSAYVIFSNKMREELKGRNLSFTEIAKLVGENWQNLSPSDKEPYEQQAFSSKERYNNELAEYKKTTNYQEYSQYLADFKARQSSQQQGMLHGAMQLYTGKGLTISAADSEVVKRPKLEAHPSTTSSTTASSTASQHDGETPVNRVRTEYSTSSVAHWHAPEGQHSPQLSGGSKMSLALGSPKRQSSPAMMKSPTILPGYRDSIYGGPQQAIPWRDNQHDDGGNSVQQPNRRPSYSGPPSDKLNLTGSIQHAHRTGQAHPPPLLASESTSRSSASSASTVSSTFYTPRTPMEPPLERALPHPSLFPQKSNSGFDNQLPPLRPPSLSPRTSTLGSLQSPNGIHALMDFPSSMAPLRSYTTTAPQQIAHDEQADSRHRDLMLSGEETILDPVSALLRAGEIVNRNSRSRNGS